MTIECAGRLAELRRSHNLSQEELAEKLNVSRQAVSKWERAESSPDTENLIALARLYGVSLDELLGLRVPPTSIPDMPCGKEEEGLPEAAEEAADAEAEEPSGPSCQKPVLPPEEELLPEGSYYAEQERRAEKERERRRWSFPYPVAVTVAYLVLGFVFHAWHPGWIIFLTVPLFYLPDSQRTPLRLLGNPVMITIIYLLLGTMCGLWHPGWLIFLLIPLLNR